MKSYKLASLHKMQQKNLNCYISHCNTAHSECMFCKIWVLQSEKNAIMVYLQCALDRKKNGWQPFGGWKEAAQFTFILRS